MKRRLKTMRVAKPVPELRVLDSKDLRKEDVLSLLLERRRREQGIEPSNDYRKQASESLDRLLASSITKNLLAYSESGELLGWLGVTELFPTTMLLCEYHPIIRSCKSSPQVARNLLLRCFEYAREKGVRNVRTFVEVLKENEERFHQLREYLQESGMRLAHVVFCMESRISAEGLRKSSMPSGYLAAPLKDQSIESLNECHAAIFSGGSDRFTASLEKDELAHWDFFEEKPLNDASIVVKYRNELVALIAANDREAYVELGPVGVVAEHRGKHLGRALMDGCLSSLVRQGKTDCYLEVDTENTPAIHLYSSYGFHEVSKKYGFLIRLQP